jgi:hypothetical protein
MTRYLCAGLLLMALGLASGCGGQSLRTDEDVSAFLRDLADGKGDNGWHLGDHPSLTASLAWQHGRFTSDLGRKLHEDGREWACNAAKAVETAPKIANGIYPPTITSGDRSTILVGATRSGASSNDVEELINDFLNATVEGAEVVSKACDALDHLEG